MGGRDIPQEKFLFGEIPHGRIFCKRNFPLGGWNFQEIFFTEEFFRQDSKMD